ncbi:gamma-glutamyl-gamma-aminobutyrate hydrolase family protein [Nitratireductor basaltis]|uniref:gamma-glutamyl-gamma-aminobutyrate hydrolase n=1 Tax=Nitratireductor basaltis TaxID=472175 RepID=A0A084U7Z4_9HYPH|nr:gamma-glutamyl-gamma-aminobutyrate hydrolase family protein [Nitratireductor basaltis]KFB09080.1 putative glutamine amidotransferase [Nitratireductor basaltis]
MSKPLIAVSTDVKSFENYEWHAAPEQYLRAAIRAAGVTPLLVPSFEGELDLDVILDGVDGVMLTGSKSNVWPELYGEEATEGNGPYDRRRDGTTIPLIRAAIKRGIPLLAICRGIQELNVAMGGSLATELQELPGRMDHRAPENATQDERFAIRQDIKIKAGSCLADIFNSEAVRVNTIHRQGIDRLGEGLDVEAVAPDGTVEAVSVRGTKAFAVGVQWHPEYWAESDAPSRQIFASFGEAVRAHHAARHARSDAA